MSRFILIEDELGLGLKDCLTDQKPLRIDFNSPQLTYRRLSGGKKELLIRAVKARPGCRVWDCTAGLGVDSFLLAAHGCQVRMFERSKIMAKLLEEAMLKAARISSTEEIIARMELVHVDAIAMLKKVNRDQGGAFLADVILLDPMFPARKKSALVNGKMQILQRFLGADEDALSLLTAALNSGVKRVVIKRPANGGELQGLQPSFSLSAKSNRFDVFINSADKNQA
ncbi:MAG: class I SAM-dependent methyltransferase [Pseudomonadales bacterium]|nr:class I SAM-dependent methyltransferase [Pseudomonadales bacterium]